MKREEITTAVIYRIAYELLKEFEDIELRNAIAYSIIEYAFTGHYKDTGKQGRFVMTIVKPLMDKSIQKYLDKVNATEEDNQHD